MRIPRIFVQQPLPLGQAVSLDKEASIHIARVLRLKAEHKLELFNGDGHSYQATIIQAEKNSVQVHVLESKQQDLESPLNLHLFQGVSRGDKMDLTLQKGVELGVKSFTPVISERCGVKLDEKRWQKRLSHWQKVIESACEQSGRNIIPKLEPLLHLDHAQEKMNQQSYFLHPHAAKPFKALDPPDLAQEIQIWIGPEGGFSDNECQLVEQFGATPVSLGPRILRTETAALATVSCINTLWGDF